MEKIIEEIMKNRLFKGIESEELREVINIFNYKLSTYEKD